MTTSCARTFAKDGHVQEIHKKSAKQGHKAVVFGLFCRVFPGFNKEHNRGSPTKVEPTNEYGVINKRRPRSFAGLGLKTFTGLRPIGRRVLYAHY